MSPPTANARGGTLRMAVVTCQLARAAIVDVPTVVLALASAILLLKYRFPSPWLVLSGGIAGLGLSVAGFGR